MSEIHVYEKEELKKDINKKRFGELEKFALNNAGNGKVYKLREVLAEFDPVHTQIFIVGVCGRKIKMKLDTYDFPDGERRVGIEFAEVVVARDDEI